jgi:hypothetical protein
LAINFLILFSIKKLGIVQQSVTILLKFEEITIVFRAAFYGYGLGLGIL